MLERIKNIKICHLIIGGTLFEKKGMLLFQSRQWGMPNFDLPKASYPFNPFSISSMVGRLLSYSFGKTLESSNELIPKGSLHDSKEYLASISFLPLQMSNPIVLSSRSVLSR